MKRIPLSLLLLSGFIAFSSCTKPKRPGEKILLTNNWNIQSSATITSGGENISLTSFDPSGWYPTTVPATVMATLVKNKVYPDPYYGNNIDSIPGYVRGNMREMPEDSPFIVPWWYRTVFTIPSDFKGKNIWLDFNGINYRANIWVNGKKLADTTQIEGAYRNYKIDISPVAVPGAENCLALEIYPPRKMDLTITWVDWNPTPPDRAMGIWYDVSLHASGPVSIENPHVVTALNLPAVDTANITVSAILKNSSDRKIFGSLTGEIQDISFSQQVDLAPGETKQVTFTPEEYPQLIFSHPKLWWPRNAGPQNLYDLRLRFMQGGSLSDIKYQRFGIREVTSTINQFDGKRTRVFQVNGKNVLIRGGGFVEDMMLRPSKENIETAVNYAKHMNLNTLRMEAPRGPDYLYDLCDQEGILLMVGWCCCSSWERWSHWTPHTADIAEASWKDLILRLRNHPSVFTWLYGSDNYPPADIEKRYINVLDIYDGTRPYESSATQDSSAIAGYTGLWMGPYPQVYAYFPPAYWYGKLEFNTEAAPAGEQIPPVESMKKMMPEKDLWPMSKSWNIRLHRQFYPYARKALNSRYGEPTGLEEYSIKSQVLQKEAVRAMFEAFARNKYRASGIIYWMYNSAWPSLYWQLYDYFLTPNGAFYGTRKACEPLHVQYSYDDSTIYVVNGFYHGFRQLTVKASVYNLDMTEKYSRSVNVDIGPDKSLKVMDIDWPEDLSSVYFLKLDLSSASDSLISSNFYWLSTQGDQQADFTALNHLPEVNLEINVSSVTQKDGKVTAEVTFSNPTATLAFAINPSIQKPETGELVTPVYWDDNYFSLLPQEKRLVKVVFPAPTSGNGTPLLVVSGWNIKRSEKNLE